MYYQTTTTTATYVIALSHTFYTYTHLLLRIDNRAFIYYLWCYVIVSYLWLFTRTFDATTNDRYQRRTAVTASVPRDDVPPARGSVTCEDDSTNSRQTPFLARSYFSRERRRRFCASPESSPSIAAIAARSSLHVQHALDISESSGLLARPTSVRPPDPPKPSGTSPPPCSAVTVRVTMAFY